MRFRKILAALLIAITAGSSVALAQVLSGAASKGPWNGYTAQRIPDAYVTIIGQPGTTLIPSSQTATNSSLFNLTIPFAFRFMGTNYAANTVARVAAAGYISFASPSSPGTPTLAQDANTRLIAPYWAELQANAVQEGGVYWRVDGPIGARVLTVEWRVMGITTKQPTRNPGEFQAKLFETSNKIEFFYGPNSINRGESNTSLGAIVGLKNSGQSNTVGGAEDDSQKFMIFPNPDRIRDTVFVTRTRVGVGAAGQTAENVANWPYTITGLTGISPYFHTNFPTLNGVRIGYRMTSVTDDVSADQVTFEPSRPGNAFAQGSSFVIRGVFRNLGTNPRSGGVPVELQILRGGTVIETRTGTAFTVPTGSGATSTVTFVPPIGSSITAVPGTYTARLIVRMTSPADQDATNDVIDQTFFVVFPRDVMPDRIIEPITYSLQSPAVYTVGAVMRIEARFLNLGLLTLSNVPVGYIVRDALCNEIARGNGVVRGNWAPLEYRDVVFEEFQPLSPGQYFIQVFTNAGEDDQRSNDTLPRYSPTVCGREFSVRYERELQVREGTLGGVEPLGGGNYPVGRPINVNIAYRNNGITDATNIPSRVIIRNPNGDVVYDRTTTVLSIPGEASGNGTTIYSPFPYFVPTSGPGQYCVTATINDPSDPVTNNNTSTWCFNVRPPLAGVIYVGTGERFRTIQEANDSLYFYGVGAPVTFKLVNDVYTVRPDNDSPLRPALDGRGDVYGSGPNTMVTWMAAEGKTNVRIILKSPSGTGIIYGQRDTSNPTGYITWDGGPTKNLTFILDTAGNRPPMRAIPFEFAQGASNYTVRNVNIMPVTIPLGRKDSSAFPIHEYFRSVSTFRYVKDDSLRFSAGILVRNSAPADGQNQNPTQRDTLFNRNNTFEGNVIKNFAYGIVSIGAGPLFRIGDNRYTDYSNQNTRILNNRLDSVTRAGVAVAFEKNSEIAGNVITNVINTSTVNPSAAGIWVTSGGLTGANATRNRGFSSDLLIQRNKISQVRTTAGNAAGIWAETNENVFFESTVYRFPVNGATNFRIWNNMVWDYRTSAQTGSIIAGVGLTMAGDTRIDLVTSGNNVDNNTIYNVAAGSAQEYGVVTQRATGTVRNNIISILSPSSSNPIGVVLQGPELSRRVVSDYNIFWVPNGFVGALSNLSVNGFNIPSPPTARTLNQWRALSGQDQNSIEGNVTTEFVSTTPGAEDLHIRTTTVGSLANNRGVVIPGMTVDIDTDPRNPGGGTSRPDIGADEFNGVVRNNDLLAEDLISPAGYRAQTGQFSDAEYVMADSVTLTGRFRNMGGLPQLANTVRMTVEYFNPTSSSWVPVANQPSFTQTTSFDVAQSRTINFGTFAPRTLRQFGINDSYFGLNPNVTPLYRFRLTSGTDDFSGNNIYEKVVRFYLLRSTRQALVSVENRVTAMPGDAIGKSNKLNADTLVAALDSIRWQRADNSGLEDYDLFDRDRWPKENLNFRPWKTVIWAQGAEPQGMEPEERAALMSMLDSRDMYNRSNLIIAGQDVARIHDVVLDATNGNVSDTLFVRRYLRANYRGNTNPADYSNRVIRGVAINPGRYERIRATGVTGDNAPRPSLLRPTLGQGISRATHNFWEQEFGTYADSAAGVATSEMNHNVIFYSIDWRHYGRFAFEERSSGAQRLLLSALDFANQYQGVVPVKVSAFDANQSGRKAVRVEWTTASEVEVASLEVERAVIERTEQGVREGAYTLVDRKAPAGTATRGAKYSILDQNVEVGAEYRYRLVSVGLDGSRSVDAMDEVKIIGAGEAAGFVLSLQPNPAREFTTIELRMPEAGKTTVKLYDAAGRLVRVLVDRAELQAVSSLELNVRDLSSGVYTIAVETLNTTLVQKLNVQK